MLDTKYNHLEVEKNKYENWKEKGYFESGDLSLKPFCIVIPPPNVTGKLHLGHAWDTTLQDIIIRYKRMDGYDTLWIPGMDHAGIATQAKVDKKLKSEGIDPRSMDREEWLKIAWDWKYEYANNIHKQWAKMGLSLDYTKERFTLDEGLSKAVNKVFIDLYNKGYIYRGERIINWDPEAMTALSNEEVIYKDVKGAFYHLKYYLEDSSEYLEVATTRPETLFGDTAVAVNPDDSRYKHLIGKKVKLPIVNKLIPIVGDIHADPEFGTGVVKITPSVGHSERTDVMVEPYLSKQWFVKMDVLAKQVLDNQKNKDKKVNFIPARFEKILNHWMEDCHDWCISRQLWWGHRIPAWYKNDEVKVQVECPGEGWIQDSDVLDTWFSSALWPFSTLGWPEHTNLLDRYFPNNVLVTGYDIIFFWVCRMVFQSLEFMHERPFKECLIHGLIRDKEGRKMSKSLGNGVDPMDVIEEYGCDSLRYFLATSTAPGMDLRYDSEKVASTWNFINKLWNASRFVLMNLETWDKVEDYSNLTNSDKWILNKLNNTIKTVRKHMDKYEFNVVGSEIYSFIWNDFCDWYIELAKINMNNTTKTVLFRVLTDILKMLHPFMPYVTEEIYLMLPIHDESIMISSYPKENKEFKFKNLDTDSLIELITRIRRFKLENNIKEYILVSKSSLVLNNVDILMRLTKPKEIKEKYNNKELDTLDINIDDALVTLYYDNSVNKEAELAQLRKEKERLEASIMRRKKLLANEGYVSKAPLHLVENERNTLKAEEQQLEIINKKLS